MTEYEQGYLEGLNAAAMLCEWETKGKDSRFAPMIRQMAMRLMLKLDTPQGNRHNGGTTAGKNHGM